MTKQTWRIPVEWMMCEYLEVTAESFEEALKVARQADIPDFKADQYVCDSFHVNQSMLDYLGQPEKKLLIEGFVYEGLRFKPLKTLEGAESNFSAVSKRIRDSKLTPKNWSHEAFYAVAREFGAGDIDLFEMNGKVVIPCENILFEYRM